MFFGIFLELLKVTIAGPTLIQCFTRKMTMFYMDFLPDFNPIEIREIRSPDREIGGFY